LQRFDYVLLKPDLDFYMNIEEEKNAMKIEAGRKKITKDAKK
jgi:hypothetical protein